MMTITKKELGRKRIISNDRDYKINNKLANLVSFQSLIRWYVIYPDSLYQMCWN